jgi:ubiquinol-cytochrome c reductase cytochrome b subunit
MWRFVAATACSILLTAMAVLAFGLTITPGMAAHPMRILPEWWALPAFAVLKAVPTKFGAIATALAGVFGFFLLPWIVLKDARNRLCRPVAIVAAAGFLLAILALGFSGAHNPAASAFPGAPGPFLLDANLNSQLWLSRAAAAYYFAYIAFIAPALGWRRKPDTAAVFA